MKFISRLPLPLIFSLLLIVGGSAGWSLRTAAQDEDAAAAAQQGTPGDSKKRATTKILTAPFKFIGRLFGGRHKSASARQTTADEARKADTAASFESAAVARVSSSAERAESETLMAQTLHASAQEQVARGRELLNQGRHREAATVLAQATSLDPSLVEARVLLATAFDLQGLRGRAATHYREVLDRQQPHDAQTALALNNRGYSLYLAGDYKEAHKLISQAVAFDGSNARFLNNLGLVSFRLNKHKEAARAFAKAGGEVQGHVNLAILFEQDGRTRDALKYYERARRLNPSSELVRQRMQALDERAAREARLAVQSNLPD